MLTIALGGGFYWITELTLLDAKKLYTPISAPSWQEEEVFSQVDFPWVLRPSLLQNSFVKCIMSKGESETALWSEAAGQYHHPRTIVIRCDEAHYEIFRIIWKKPTIKFSVMAGERVRISAGANLPMEPLFLSRSSRKYRSKWNVSEYSGRPVSWRSQQNGRGDSNTCRVQNEAWVDQQHDGCYCQRYCYFQGDHSEAISSSLCIISRTFAWTGTANVIGKRASFHCWKSERNSRNGNLFPMAFLMSKSNCFRGISITYPRINQQGTPIYIAFVIGGVDTYPNRTIKV